VRAKAAREFCATSELKSREAGLGAAELFHVLLISPAFTLIAGVAQT
jgi:hypothetical protein